MEFRRNHVTPLRGRSFLKRAILLVFVVLAMIFWGAVLSTKITIPADHPKLTVSFIDSTHYLIGKDTTNYDDFASMLIAKIKSLKKEASHIDLLLTVPKNKNAGQIADIIQIVNAFDGVNLKIATY